MAANFRGCFSAASQTPIKGKSTTPTNDRVGSSVFFRVTGNVYPTGHYSVILNIGNPPKAFDLDIDTGSDLTWVQCDAPCKGCTKPLDKLYKPKNNRVPCASSLCQAIQNNNCDIPTEQCDYEVEYADLGSSLGVLLSDYFPLRLNNGSLLQPRIAFGCGYDQKYLGPHSPPDTAGILGLGRGKASILSQLRTLGITQNVVGHCFSRVTGGFLFFGDHLLPPSGITWTPMLRSSSDTLYSSGPAELLFGGKPTGIKGLQLIFDSGSSYTYFNAQVYQSILNLVRKDLSGMPLKDAPEEKALAVCWKTAKPIKSILDIKSFFKPLTINFIKAKNVQLQLAPEDYLIITKDGNVCLGILNGGEQGLGNLNVIGDIFMQDRVVVYDNERQQIGWFPTNCNRLPNVDREYNEGFSQPYAAYFGILEEHCPATYASEKTKLFTKK